MPFRWNLSRTLHTSLLSTSLLLGVSAFAQQPVPTGVKRPGPNLTPRWQTINLGAKGRHYPFPVYANHNLTHDDLKHITRVIVIVHGLQRSANLYYSALVDLLDTPTRTADTLIIGPRFSSNIEPVFAAMPAWHTLSWVEGADSVRATGRPAPVSSFQVLDDLVYMLSDRHRLPALKQIVMAGHSAGGQMVQRYAVLNDIDTKRERSNVRMHYVVANPSSYLYPTAQRPQRQGSGYAPYERGICPTYNHYKYGMERLPPYAKERNPTRLFTRYAGRTVTYLIGEADNNPEENFLDEGCGAEAQGATRRARGLHYVHYEALLAARRQPPLSLAHSAYEVIGVGHDGPTMLHSVCGLQALLGEAISMPDDAAPCRVITTLTTDDKS